MTVFHNRLLTKWLRKCHRALRAGVMLLRKLIWQWLFLGLNYSYSVNLWHYCSAEYQYIIWPTIRAESNTNKIFGTALDLMV